MKKQKEKEKWRAKYNYVPPKFEVFAAKADSLLVGGTHLDAIHLDAINDGSFTTAGAKEVSGFEIKFSDVWEE